MPFDPRTKSRKTTTLPAALRDELGLPAPSAQRRSFRPHGGGGNRFDSRNGSGKPQLKAIGRPQSAINGAAKGAPRGPIKSLRNQEKEQQEQQQQRRQQHRAQPSSSAQHKGRPSSSNNHNSPSASTSRPSASNDASTSQKRKLDKQPEGPLKVIKKPKSTKPPSPQPEPVEQKQRLNPFTGELEVVKPTKKKSTSTKPTALEKMLARAEAGPSSSSRAGASDALGGGKKKSRRHMTQQEKEDEDEIRWLEYSLGKSRQGEDVVRDDLDDFLDDLDRFQVGMYDGSDSEEDEEEGEDESDDSGLEDVTASEEESEEDESEKSEEDAEESEDQEASVSEDDDMAGAEEEEGMYDFDSNDEDDFSNWDVAMATTDEEGQDDDDDDHESDESEEDDSEAEEARALIAGSSATAPSDSTTSTSAPPTSAAASTTATKYIPPALRAKLAAESCASSTPAPPSASSGPGVTDAEMDPVAAQKLRRQAQGLLNRLGDGNIDTILTEYGNLYRAHPRAHVTSTITQLIIDTITSRSNLIDTFVILHAALVAALHKVIGVEFAAFFIQRLVEELTKHYNALKADAAAGDAQEDAEEEGKGKECLNLTVLACELYNLHVVACPLIYDLIRMFLGEHSSDTDAGSITEVDIELLLRTIRCCGHQLRSDDSTSLKSIITLAQSRVSSTASSTRTKFMLERMADLQKNAKSSKSVNANDASNPNSPSGQLLTRMKKFLGGLGKKRTVKAYEALRIGLKDLQDADKKGKWWLVGAAWTGQSDQSDAQGLTKLLPMSARSSAIQSVSQTHDSQQEKLLDLARAQGMNTDARRSVFITLITAEDYRQAAENLLLLKLNDVQRREIIRVLVHCVGSEAVYNPYYTLIGQEICRNDYGMKVTLQYCLWDFLREVGQKEVGGEKFAAALFSTDNDEGKGVDPRRVGNMARAYAWWMTHDCLSLQSLKTVDFALLNPRPAQFLGLLMVHLVLSIQASSPSKTLHLPSITRGLKADKLVKFVQANLLGGSADLCRGLLFFLNTKLDARAQKKLVLGEEAKDKAVRRQMEPLLETVREGLGVVLKTVEAIVQQQDGVGEAVDPLDGASDDDDVDDDEY